MSKNLLRHSGKDLLDFVPTNRVRELHISLYVCFFRVWCNFLLVDNVSCDSIVNHFVQVDHCCAVVIKDCNAARTESALHGVLDGGHRSLLLSISHKSVMKSQIALIPCMSSTLVSVDVSTE